MPEATLTAVIVPVSAAEPVVAGHRLRLDRAATWGVPAHVTVLFPFVPPTLVNNEVVHRLVDVFAATLPFDCTFAECRWFGDDVLWLAPDRVQELRDLTRAVVHRFPAHLPYRGQFDDDVPHLTIGDTRYGTTADLRAAEADVRRRLPLAARIDHALLVAGTDHPRSWHTVAELPFGTASRRPESSGLRRA
ncbi:2'-5' RNA ligase family protein [Xylanimonas sp. McL0601]|uniref:2'-5' RNA ligase family protein n=1 Tax=Xylanimonas sp. McL0601 TaxID=3414739 RepID=UPI003CF77B77